MNTHNPVWCRKPIKRQLLPAPCSIHYLSSCDIINSGCTTATNLNRTNRIESCAYREAVLIERSLARILFIINIRPISFLPVVILILLSPGNSSVWKLSRLNFLWATDISYFTAAQEMRHSQKRFSHRDVSLKFKEQCSQTIFLNFL